MKYKYLGKKEIIDVKEDKALTFLYCNVLGRMILKILYNTWVSKFVGFFLNRRVSKIFIKKYVKNHDIDLSLYEDKKYKSFNEFFVRKIKKINKVSNKDCFIANCDCKISVYKIDSDLVLNVKQSKYDIKELIKDEETASLYNDGYAIVYRLEPSNYHRYIYIDDGMLLSHKVIKGKLHTVNPIVYDKYNVFTENTREVSVLQTDNFDKIVQIEVGALCVGKIRNNNCSKFKRYDEKGYFEFGGSTIIHLIKKDVIDIEKEIIDNTMSDIETRVSVGDVIGKKR